MSDQKKIPNYWDYLRLKPLLGLQGGLGVNEEDLQNDELHFIVTHQSLELWFKLMLAELRLARNHLASPNLPEEQVPHVVHHLRRVSEILRLATRTFGVMETLTPQDFMNFRDKLTPASGFQSFQMREIELMMGIDWGGRVKYGKVDPLDHIRKLAGTSEAGPLAVERIDAALAETSLRDALHRWLFRTPIQGSNSDDEGDEEAIEAFLISYANAVQKHHESQRDRLIESSVGRMDAITAKFAENTRIAREYLFAHDIEDKSRRRFVRRYRSALVFIESYRELPLLAWPRLLIDAIVEVESQMVMFRHRHARAVERIIGRRIGTGGSSGVDYLDKTTQIRIFTDLWTVRTLLLPKALRPELQHPDFYGFQF